MGFIAKQTLIQLGYPDSCLHVTLYNYGFVSCCVFSCRNCSCQLFHDHTRKVHDTDLIILTHAESWLDVYSVLVIACTAYFARHNYYLQIFNLLLVAFCNIALRLRSWFLVYQAVKIKKLGIDFDSTST